MPGSGTFFGTSFDHTSPRLGEAHVNFWISFPTGFGGFRAFSISSADSWITVTKSNSSGPSSDPVFADIAPYSGPNIRIGYISYVVPTAPTSNGYIRVIQLGVPVFSLQPNPPGTPNANSFHAAASGGTASPLVQQDLTQTADHPNFGFALADGWTATCPDSWVTLVPTVGRPAEPVTDTGVSGVIYQRPLSISIAANGSTSPPRTSVVTVTPNATLGFINSGTLANDFIFAGSKLFTITQDAGASYIAPGGGPGDGPPPPPGNYSNPFCIPDKQTGFYLRSCIDASLRVWVMRANQVGPFGGFTVGGTATGTGSATNPRIAYSSDFRRLLCSYQLTGDTHVVISDDDCHTWVSGTGAIIPGGVWPTIVEGGDRTLIVAAYVAPTGGATYGTIHAVQQGPGDSTFGSPYTLKDNTGTALQPANDSFHIISRTGGDRVWLLCGTFGTDTGPSIWYSADPDASTWTRIASSGLSGSHPTIAEGQDRTLIIGVYVSPTGGATYGTIQAVATTPGDVVLGSPYTLKDHTGTALAVQNNSFHLCQPPNGARPWILTVMIGGDSSATEWWSAEPTGASWTKVV